MNCKTVIFTGHAMRRMFERDISPDQVEQVIADGETIASYPDDRPYPSHLILGFVGGLPLHVVLGYDGASASCHIITVYRPDRNYWNDDFKTRRRG